MSWNRNECKPLFVGADVAALCQGAAMVALRRRIADKQRNGGGAGGARGADADTLASGMGAMSLGGGVGSSGGGDSGGSINGSGIIVGGGGSGAGGEISGGGAAVVTHADFMAARVRIRPSALREVAVEVPRVGWDDVGGLGDVKQRLQEAVEWSERHPEAMARMGAKPPKGILLYGPPGCSKTMLARAVASASGRNFLTVKAGQCRLTPSNAR